MKKIFIILLLWAISLNAQSWNSIITTSINVTNVEYIENHADKDGIHVVTFDYYYDIKYYLLNTSGTTIRSSTISTDGEFPNIVGDESGIYVVYREGSNIRVKKSTNAGASWSQRTNQSIGSNPCSGIDATINADGVHVVWSIGDASGSEMETNYKRFDDGYNNWYDFYNVTNYSGGYGTSPTVALSSNRVHVGYNSNHFIDTYYTFDADEMSRTKYYSTWQTQQTIASSQSGRGKIFAASSKLYDFYYDFVPGMGQWHSDLYFKNRNYGSTSWSSSTLLDGWSDVTLPLVICETANGYIHTFTANSSNDFIERVIINGSISSTTDIASGYIICFDASSAYNDVYLNWCPDGATIYLKLRQYDAAPAAPQNLQASSSNNHPYLTWDENKGPDIDYYEIWKKGGDEGGDWHLKATTSNNYYTDNSETVVTGPLQANEGKAYYKIRAVDLNDNISSYSSQVEIRIKLDAPEKKSADGYESIADNFILYDNYPNPFNPSTVLAYNIPDADHVNLKVYNTLGKEIAELVNQNMAAGYHEVVFNAEDLPSGIYFYKIASGNYSAIKKMILLR